MNWARAVEALQLLALLALVLVVVGIKRDVRRAMDPRE